MLCASVFVFWFVWLLSTSTSCWSYIQSRSCCAEFFLVCSPTVPSCAGPLWLFFWVSCFPLWSQGLRSSLIFLRFGLGVEVSLSLVLFFGGLFGILELKILLSVFQSTAVLLENAKYSNTRKKFAKQIAPIDIQVKYIINNHTRKT